MASKGYMDIDMAFNVIDQLQKQKNTFRVYKTIELFLSKKFPQKDYPEKIVIPAVGYDNSLIQ